MTRFIHDQFAKDYLEELLKPYGEVKSSEKVPREVREIDVTFVPFAASKSSLLTLGLLWKIAAKPAIFEPFRNSASEDEICDCLLKLLEVKGGLRREAKRNKTPLRPSALPTLWILTPTASFKKLSGFNFVQQRGWLPGIYFLGQTLRTAIIVIHQLPSTEETLWLRLLGRDNVQKQAIDELEALPSDHQLRSVALELLYNLQQNLSLTKKAKKYDQEFVMRLAPLYQQDREKAKQEGRQEGRQEGEQYLIICQLHRRLGEIDSSLIEQVRGLSSEQLEVLGEALLDFSTVTDLQAWLVALI
ncbi:MAG: DUF4351 domain-containing protein [Nostocaceae cyanobacterium]|nr:DUF4351 domain-containing protein [Nostocaceae cyanobacterium]